MPVLRLLALLLAVEAASVVAHGHLPTAYLVPSPDGQRRGDANTLAAQAELAALAAALLEDPSVPGSSWPWKRVVINASADGARPNDGEEDAAALEKTISGACDTSKQLYQEYLNKTAADPTLPRLPSGPDDRPILVEVRFDTGRYDMVAGKGPFGYNALSGCAHLLLNGQNATIVTHSPRGWMRNSDRIDSWLLACHGCTNMAVFDFVFDTAEPSTTMGTVTQVLKNATGYLLGMDIAVAPHHVPWDDNYTTVQQVLLDGAFDLWGSPGASYAGWPGATTSLCGPACMKVVFLPPGATNREHQGNIAGRCSDGGVRPECEIAVGQTYGFARGYSIGAIQMQDSNTSVVQGLRSIGMGASVDMPGRGADVDIIDVHVDRLYPAPMFVWLDNHGWPGQSSKSGRFRIMHTSMESGSDDVLDDLATESDIIAIHRNNNTVDNLELHGRFGNASCSMGLNVPAGVKVEIGHASDPYSPYATLTVAYTTKLACGRSVTFVEPLPYEMNVTDFMSPQMAPHLLHVKNVRAGNHEYNLFNVKAHEMIFEQCFFYNETMAAVDISTDGFYWYEGPRANNIQVKDCCFQRCASAISILSKTWMGPGPTQGHVAPHATHNVSLTNNWIYHNASVHSGSPQYPGVMIDLGAVGNMTFADNEIFLEVW